MNLPIGVWALITTLRYVEESKGTAARRPDWTGCATFAAALAALVYGLIRSQADGWGSLSVGSSLGAAVVLLVGFVAIERRSPAPMFDLALLRVPAFGGGLIAAWGISASIFSMLTFLVIYLQNVLGYTALQAGLRLLPLTGAIFLTAGIAGRLTDRLPTRWLIGAGFVLVGVGLLWMRGLHAGSDWTHLLPGFVVAGAGLINVPLASTAVDVVDPDRAGMASGINSTLRQVGIATGVAALGSILASHLQAAVTAQLQTGPLAAHAHQIASQISGGSVAQALQSAPPSQRGALLAATKAGYAGALDHILLIAALVAFASAALTTVLIRPRDFTTAHVTPTDPNPETVSTQLER